MLLVRPPVVVTLRRVTVRTRVRVGRVVAFGRHGASFSGAAPRSPADSYGRQHSGRGALGSPNRTGRPTERIALASARVCRFAAAATVSRESASRRPVGRRWPRVRIGPERALDRL